MIKAVVVDDEVNWAEELKRMLEAYYTDIKIDAVCHDINEAETAFDKFNPDLVFLDVELGKSQTSFDLLRKISPVTFSIIFITSYNHFAIQAIKLSAIDYLLKPVDEGELKMAIEKYRQEKSRANPDRVESLLTAWVNPGNQENKIPLPTPMGYEWFTIADIIYLEVVDNQTIIMLNSKKSSIISLTLKQCEDLLTLCKFYRIHKSYLINLNHVKKYIKGKEGVAIMSNNASLTVSRNIKHKFIERLKFPLYSF